MVRFEKSVRMHCRQEDMRKERLTMNEKQQSLGDVLERLFHEPNRLAIMSALCAADSGLPFSELRERCGLTDGNLNRHLKALEEAGAVRITKKFVDAKPQTKIFVSKQGLDRFSDYLAALSEVLEQARNSMPATKTAKDAPLSLARTVTA